MEPWNTEARLKKLAYVYTTEKATTFFPANNHSLAKHQLDWLYTRSATIGK